MRPEHEQEFDSGRQRCTRGCLRFRTVLLSLALMVNASVAAAQAPSAASPEARVPADSATKPKSALTATLLSGAVPGFGHLYAGEKRTGWVLVGLWVGALAIGAGGENATSSPLALVLVAGPWWYGVVDAHNAVARYNKKLALRVSVAPHVWPRYAGSGGLAPRVGLGVRVGL